ncbi:MAG: fatty acid desaturase family protein [Burkholderiales bacterium]
MPVVPGDEFRDDLRQAERALPADVLGRLTVLDDRQSWKAMLGTVAAALGAVGVAAWAWTPWVVVPAIVIIATRQHAMFVLAHEAAHYRLLSARRRNDVVGRWLGRVNGISMCSYRVVHRLHHNHLYGPQDPDLALHGGYPRGRVYLLRKLAADVCGLTAWKTFRYFFGDPAANAATGEKPRPLDDTSPALRTAALKDRWGVVVWHLAVPVGMALAAGPPGLLRYVVLWLVPLATVLQALLRLRAIAEHGAPLGTGSCLVAARTHRTGRLARFFLFPHHVNFHVEHHLYPAVPQYRLPALHEELARRGVLRHADVRSLAQTWRRVYAPRATR